MRLSADTAAKAYIEIYEQALDADKSARQNFSEADHEVIMEQLRFAEKLFPKSGLGLCPISHQNPRYSSPNCALILGHPLSHIMNWSPAEFLSFVHPDDLLSLQQSFVFMKNFESADPENYRFHIQFRFRTQLGEYEHIKTEQLSIATRANRYLYITLYNNISAEEKFYHVKMDVFKKINGNYLKTYTYNPQQGDKVMTPRQHDIARLVIKGFTNQEIADSLGVSVFTVKNHKKTLFKKVNVKNSVELANYVKQVSADV